MILRRELICSPINRNETQSLAFIQLTTLHFTSNRLSYIYSIRMADRFPDIPLAVDPADAHNDYCFDHLISSVKKGQAPEELWRPRGVAIDSNNNQIYVTDGYYGSRNSFAHVSIFSDAGEFLNTFSHPDMKWPHGIAIHRDNVYVTDVVEDSVFHFKVETHFRLVARVGSRGSGIGQFDRPVQLAVSTNGDVFVADSNNHRVQIFDCKLHYQRHLSLHYSTLSRDIKLTQDEVYILCHKKYKIYFSRYPPSSPCILVFTYSGVIIRSLIMSLPDCDIVYPTFFCLDANSNFLISDESQIKILSKEGTLLQTFGEHGHEIGMFRIFGGIALTENRKLIVVSQNSMHCLQIFSFA